MFYVYIHRKASDGTVFYVGKGKGRRAWWSNGRNKHWHNVVKMHGYTVEICKDGLSESDAFDLEKDLISKYGIDNLCNYTLGGDGASGVKKTEEFKEMMREKMKGREFSEETIKKMRKAAKNRPESQRIKQASKIRGRKLSDEHKRKISEAGMGRVPSEETKKKISEFHKGKKKRPEAVAAMAASKSKPVFCVTNGEEYKSQREAARVLGVSSSKVSDVINGKIASTRGYIFIGIER